MMKKVYLTSAGAALACALVVFFVFRAQKNENAAAVNEAKLAAKEKAAAVTSIVTAGRDIPKGTVLTQDMLSSLEVDRNILLSLDALESMAPAIGCISLRDFAKGEAVTMSGIRDAGLSGSELSCLIPEGMCAVQIKTSPDNSVAGHIEAGDTVDIVFRSALSGDPGESGWEVLAGGIRVLRLGERIWDGEGEYRYLVVAAEEKTILKLLDAVDTGEIKLLLKPSGYTEANISSQKED